MNQISSKHLRVTHTRRVCHHGRQYKQKRGRVLVLSLQRRLIDLTYLLFFAVPIPGFILTFEFSLHHTCCLLHCPCAILFFFLLCCRITKQSSADFAAHPCADDHPHLGDYRSTIGDDPSHRLAMRSRGNKGRLDQSPD